MFIDDQKYKRNGKEYRRVLLRSGKRVGGKVKLKTIANISDCSAQEIQALKIALKNSDSLSKVVKLANFECFAGKIFSVVYLLNEIAKRINLHEIFGKSKEALLCIWLIFARIIDQGSRLSSVRLAKIHGGCELLGIAKLNENILYNALDWLYENKEQIEKRTFKTWQSQNKAPGPDKNIFLYDVTSSYFEGNLNELAVFGYNRDKKKGKKIVVYGLLTDSAGEALGIEVFPGNTSDNKTVSSQIEKIKKKYNVNNVTFVGDKGMIKSGQIEELQEAEIKYITTITKPQIESLIKKGTLQLELFDETLFEIQLPQEKNNEGGEKITRYILRRNPVRALEMKKNKYSKIVACREKLIRSNIYLQEHPRASVGVQLRNINNWLKKMKIEKFVAILENENQRSIKLVVDYHQLNESSNLDGCYVVKTDLPQHMIKKEKIHERYKDLAKVEQAFKISKSQLDARPIYLRKKERTIAHLMICMFAYKIRKHLSKTWGKIDITVEEGFETLKQIGSDVLQIGKTPRALISKPNSQCQKLLHLNNVELPQMIDYIPASVNTTKKLPSRRK